MRILLTHGYFLSEDPKEQKIMKPYPPLGLQCISAYLESNGFPNEILDTTFSNFSSFEKDLLSFKPNLVGIYTNLMTKVNIIKIIRFIRSQNTFKDTKIILGGPEVRNHKDNFLKIGADVVVFGEGEQSMLELIKYYESPTKKGLDSIPGIAFASSAGEITCNPERPLIQNLDDLPFPNRQKINQQLYLDSWKKHHGYSMLTISTMRGCPYGCKWCSRAVYGQSYRRRSPANVVAEIKDLQKKYDFDKIWFVDDVFTINHKWLRAFAQTLEREGVKIAYEAISRADRMNEEVIELLRKSGCFRIWIGAESGSQKILDFMNRMVTVDKVKSMIQLSKEYGIETGTFIMLGYPGETEADIKQTLQYLIEANPDYFTVTLAYPIKGTPLYEEVESKFINDLEWESSSDRDIDFQRTYGRKYYDHAIRWILHETDYHKMKNQRRSILSLIDKKLRSAKARLSMSIYR